MLQEEQIKTREAEAKLASFTGTLQQRLLQLATEVSCALQVETHSGCCFKPSASSDAARSAMNLYFPRNKAWYFCFYREQEKNLIYILDMTVMIRCLALI